MSVILSTSGLLLEDFVVFVVCINCSFIPSITCVVMHMVFADRKDLFAPCLFSSFLMLRTCNSTQLSIGILLYIPPFRFTVIFHLYSNAWSGRGENRIYIGDWSFSTTRSCTLSDSKKNHIPTKTLHCERYDPVTHFVGITGIPVKKRHPQKWRNWFIWVCQLCGVMKIPVVPFHKMLLQSWFMNICFVTHSTGESEVMLHGINLYIIRKIF